MERAFRSFSSHENHIGVRRTKSYSDDVDTFSYNFVNVWRSAGILSTLPGLDDSKGACQKKKKKKKKTTKKKKKGKLNKLHSHIISSSESSDMSGLKEIFVGIESTNPKAGDQQSKIGLPNPKEGDHLSKMLFYNSIPVQVDTKYSYSSYLTLNQAREHDQNSTLNKAREHDRNSTGIECSHIIVPMQDCNQLDEFSNLKATWNQDSNADVTTVSTSSSSASSARMGSYSEYTRGFETILADENHIVTGQSNCKKNEIHKTLETASELVVECEGCSDNRDGKILSMMPCLAASMISYNIVSEINLRALEDYKYSRYKKINPEEEFSMPSDIPAIELKQYDPKEGYFQRFYGKSHMLSSINNKRQQDMENTQLFRPRVRMNVGCLQSKSVKAFDDCHLMVNDISLTATSPLKLNCYKGDGLLPSPQYHCAYKHGYLPPKLSQLVAELKSSEQYIQLESRFKAADDLRAVIWQKSEDKLQQHLRSSINRHKGRVRTRENHVHEREFKPSFFPEVSPEFLRERYLHSCHLQKIDSHSIHTSHLLEETECISQGNGPSLRFSPTKQLLNEIRPHYGTHKLSAMQDATTEAFFASQNDRISSYSCSEPELLKSNVKDCITSFGNSLKSIHISLPVDNREDGDDNFIGKEEYGTKTCSATSCGEELVDRYTNVIKFENGEQVKFVSEHNGCCITVGYKVKKSSMYVGSTRAEKVLVASYKLQRDSGYVQLVTGSPIAIFEKFLTAVSPVIVPSFSIKEESDFFFTIQDHNVALRRLWSWYEKPGCYGLEIKAGDSQNLGRLKSLDEPFLAYFVPSLSAIQLFGYSQCSRKQETIEAVHQKEETGKCSLISSFLNHLCQGSSTDTKDSCLLNSMEKHTENPLHSIHEVGSTSCSNENLDSSCISSTSESKLIFEFFENDLPHERMPLYAKVKKLINDGASNLHISGNPSSLECMKFQDLHPSSWYSVAWYPIYRIPDGPFRMAFLTYHSLGHFTLHPSRSTPSKQDVVCPVLGMLSYNAKSDGWFILNENASNSLHKEQRFLDVSKLLQDRINNLMETAAVFSTGHTNMMNNVKVQNVHRDYNFFLSRQK